MWVVNDDVCLYVLSKFIAAMKGERSDLTFLIETYFSRPINFNRQAVSFMKSSCSIILLLRRCLLCCGWFLANKRSHTLVLMTAFHGSELMNNI